MSTSHANLPERPTVIIAHLRGCDELARAILMRCDVDIVTMYEEVAPAMAEMGIPHRSLWSFLEGEQAKHAVMEGTLRADILKDRMAAGALPAIDGLTTETVAEASRRMHDRLRSDLANETLIIRAVRACTAQTDLRLAVVPQDIGRDAKTLTVGARRLGVPVLHLLHGYLSGSVNLLDEALASHVAVYSEAAKTLSESLNTPPDAIHVTGNPYWDDFLQPPEPTLRPKAFRVSGLQEFEPVVVLSLSYAFRLSEIGLRNPKFAVELLDAMLDALGEVTKKHPETQVLIRPHPNWRSFIADVESRAKLRGLTRFFVDLELPTQAALAMADLVICTQSNFGIEALMQGVPVINADIESITGGIFSEGLGRLFQDDDAVVNVKSEAELAPAIESMLYDFHARRGVLQRREETLCRLNCSMLPDNTDQFGEVAAEIIMEPNAADAVCPSEALRGFVLPLIPDHAQRIGLIAGDDEWRASIEKKDCSVIDIAENDEEVDCVVVCDPAASDTSHDVFKKAERHARAGGSVVFFANHARHLEAVEAFDAGAWCPERPGADRADGFHGFSLLGLHIALSRAGLVAAAMRPMRTVSLEPRAHDDLTDPSIEGWAVQAILRTDSAGT